jgi:PIN domain nuclease of toxin-antitoxin system
MLAARERIRLDRPVRSWIRQALGLEGVRVLDLTPLAAVAAGELPEDFPGDPVDRLLYATAVELRAPLLTKDRRLRAFDGQVCRW